LVPGKLEEFEAGFEEEFSTLNLVDSISTLSKLHRIQGSEDLEVAADIVAEKVIESGLRVNVYTFDYYVKHGIEYPVVGWNVRDAVVELVKPKREILHTFRNSRTVAVAHSPAGDVEGEVVYVGNIFNADRENIDGKIVLTPATRAYVAYREAVKKGAKAVVMFRLNAPEAAVPYLGLFLTPDEAFKYSVPAVSVAKRTAEKIISLIERGEKVVLRVRVDSAFRDKAYIKVVEAQLGDGDREIHVYAHICHPGGTVNDNISGSALTLELARTFKRIIDRGLDRDLKLKTVFVWFPEYHGSVPYLYRKQTESIVFGVNIDMIGEKQPVTDSTLNFIRPPLVMATVYEAILFRELVKSLSTQKTFSGGSGILGYRLDLVPYNNGSDHDIYLQFGVPSVMLNQWPDRYYHTDMDTLDKVDVILMSRAAKAMAKTLYIASADIYSEEMKKSIFDAYISIVKGLAILRDDNPSERSKQIDLDACRTSEIKEPGPKLRYVGGKGVVSIRLLEEKIRDAAELEKFVKFLEQNSYLVSYVQILLSKYELTMEELLCMVKADYGAKVKPDDIKQTIELLEKLKLISSI